MGPTPLFFFKEYKAKRVPNIFFGKEGFSILKHLLPSHPRRNSGPVTGLHVAPECSYPSIIPGTQESGMDLNISITINSTIAEFLFQSKSAN